MSQGTDVPEIELRDGARLPLVGLGTARLTGYQAEAAVTAALAAGYRHFDTAVMYGNEAEVGTALAAGGVPREELFLTTKIRPSDIGHESAILRKSLRALHTSYLDLWLVHWPPARSQPRHQLWNALRGFRDEGLVRSIGVSNYDLEQLDDLLAVTGELPVVNQVRWSPAHHDAGVLAAHQDRGVALEGYSPLKDIALADPVLAKVAAAHGVSAAQVVLRWHLEHGIPVIPKSAHPDRIAANLDVFGFALTESEVTGIDALAGG